MGRYEGVREKRRHVRVTTLLFRNGVNGRDGEGRAKRLMVNLGLSCTEAFPLSTTRS